MKQLLAAISIFACSICYGANPLDVFNNGLDGIPWNYSSSQIQEDLTRRGISYEIEQKEDNKCDITFESDTARYTLCLQHDRFFEFTKRTEFYDPQNRSSNFWGNFIKQHYKNLQYENDNIRSLLIPIIFPNMEIDDQIQTKVTLSLHVTSKAAQRINRESSIQQTESIMQPAFDALLSNTLQK